MFLHDTYKQINRNAHQFGPKYCRMRPWGKTQANKQKPKTNKQDLAIVSFQKS